jgi:transposase
VCWGGGNQQLWGLNLARYLRVVGIEVMEVERPKRRHRRRATASLTHTRDAEAAARALLAGEAAGEPKSGDGRVEMIRVLRDRPAARR